MFFLNFETGAVDGYSQCVEEDGTVHFHDEEWSPDVCSECVCDDGFVACAVRDCLPPPTESGCMLAPVQLDECCGTYDCPPPPVRSK